MDDKPHNMSNDNHYHHLFAQLNPHTTLLTPNRRLSATLHKLYEQYMLASGKSAWQTPDILPFTSWMTRLWDDYTCQTMAKMPLLLNAAQEQFLWEKIISGAKEGHFLLQVKETAELAQSAWGLLKQWRVDIQHPLFQSTDDASAFYRWAGEFEEVCRQSDWLDNASLPERLSGIIIKGILRPAKHIKLIGFTELSPQVEYLLQACTAQGSVIEKVEINSFHQTCQRIALCDTEAEIVTMANWAKSIYQSNHQATIGCVIPSLETIRDRVMQIFAEVFTDDKTGALDIQTVSFNISAGKSMIHYPVIYTALEILAWQKKNIGIESFRHVLTSPYVGDGECEYIRRANVDSLLRQNNINQIDLSAVTENSGHHHKISLPAVCPKLTKRLSAFLEYTGSVDKYQRFTDWASSFHKLLQIMGWPGERSLNSDEYQVVENWLTIMNEFASLDQVSKPVDYHHAYQALYKAASRATFQPKSPDARIQVLGMLEAAALPFDYLWVAGLDDLSWPPQPRPNPFIPKRLQRELAMPHATAERELIYSQLLTQQFKDCSSHTIFSHAEKMDELELEPSPLIKHLPLYTLAFENNQTFSERIFASRQIEKFQDDTAPAMQSGEEVRGGVNVLKLQAICPFKAFAERRLHARELEKPLPGLRSKDRGNIVHHVLELFWNKIGSQAALCTMTDEALQTFVGECIDAALIGPANTRSDSAQYIALEKQRLAKLILNWLKFEKSRPSFNVINSEKEEQVSIGPLRLSIRVDRIDQLDNGKKLIIDYKTSQRLSIGDWFGDRPEEPQLPLYALIDPEQTAGITFAQVVTGKYNFIGISREPLEMNDIKLLAETKLTTALSWTEQLSQWRATLTTLSQDFYDGKAAVNPKDPVSTCEYCALKSLCRIGEELPCDNE